jgi:hypothetical protein
MDGIDGGLLDGGLLDGGLLYAMGQLQKLSAVDPFPVMKAKEKPTHRV